MKIIGYFIMLLSMLYSETIIPIPLHVKDVNMKKARLGKELFFDVSLSKDNLVSCASCHIIEAGGDDNLKVPFAINGKQRSINTPTVLNSRYNFAQFWDGRAKNLQEQAAGPIENPAEMGSDFTKLIEKLNSTTYKNKFKKIYDDGISKDNITDAIAEYEKTLITPNAPFDKYLRGDENAISEDAKNGYKLFKSKGCISCHNGVNIGGNLYAKFGKFRESKSASLGRYDVTKNKLDKYYFKVPTLRNIEKTAPYLHDGRFDNLKDTVKFMLNTKFSKTTTKKEINDILKFLGTLNGKLIDIVK